MRHSATSTQARLPPETVGPKTHATRRPILPAGAETVIRATPICGAPDRHFGDGLGDEPRCALWDVRVGERHPHRNAPVWSAGAAWTSTRGVHRHHVQQEMSVSPGAGQRHRDAEHSASLQRVGRAPDFGGCSRSSGDKGRT